MKKVNLSHSHSRQIASASSDPWETVSMWTINKVYIIFYGQCYSTQYWWKLVDLYIQIYFHYHSTLNSSKKYFYLGYNYFVNA